MKKIEINQKEERPRVELVSTRGLVAGTCPTLAGGPRRVRELQGTREEPEGHPERGKRTDSEHRQCAVGDRRDESRLATEEVERLGLAEGRDEPGQHEDHAHDCHQRCGDLQELRHDYTSLFGFGMYNRATIAQFRYCVKNSILRAGSQAQTKNQHFCWFHRLSLMASRIKKFSSPKIKIWFEPMFFSGFFCGFERCGFAAFPSASWRIRGGTSSPPAAAKAVRANSRILHHVGNCKFERFASLRSATNLYSILGVKTNSRFRILGEENFLILNPKTI